jgi:hypothetical protein
MACTACHAVSSGGHYCRQCGAALDPDAGASAERHPPEPSAPAGSPQTAPAYQQPMPAAAPPATGQMYSPAAAQSNGWGYASIPPQAPPPWPISHWTPMPGQGPPPRRNSTALAVGGMIAIVLILLATAATIILLVAGGGSSHTGILTQSATTSSKSEQLASP